VPSPEVIRERLARLQEEVGPAVTVVAATKYVPLREMAALVEAGVRVVGENRAQDLEAKHAEYGDAFRWHFIGHLQSNKCRDAVHLFQMIQSVDSLSLAQEINKRADEAAKTMPVLLEVNLAGEASKFGYPPKALLADLNRINALPRIEVHGLMTVPPWTMGAENSRSYFRRLREMKLQCEQVLGAPLPHLSMGMSGDFEVAIEEGATMVRIGTALFGPRRMTKTP